LNKKRGSVNVKIKGMLLYVYVSLQLFSRL
jgi:hypothetical protein